MSPAIEIAFFTGISRNFACLRQPITRRVPGILHALGEVSDRQLTETLIRQVSKCGLLPEVDTFCSQVTNCDKIVSITNVTAVLII